MNETQKSTLTRRELLGTIGKAAAVTVVAGPFVELALGQDGVVSAAEAPLAASAGVDRVVMNHGKTYLSAWSGYGAPPQLGRQAGPLRGAAPGAAPAATGPAATMTWTRVSGPGAVTFADASAATTTAQFSAPGEYVLQVMADNGTAKATSTLNVKVELPPPPAQLAPVVTTRHTITSPLWASRTKALITSWIPHCVDQINRTDPEPAGRRRHRQLHRGGEGAARRAARRAQGLRVLERVGAPDRRGDEPRADGRSAGRQGDHRGAGEDEGHARGLDSEDPRGAASGRLPADGVHAARRRAPARGRPAGADPGSIAGRPRIARITKATSPATSSSRRSITTR